VKKQYDVIVVGVGPGACAAVRMLQSLEMDTLLITPPIESGDTSRVPCILLPTSALASLETLGLAQGLHRHGVDVSTHEIRWPGPRAEEVPGRSSGLQIAEPTLRRQLLEATLGDGVDHRESAEISLQLDDADDGASRVLGVKMPGGFVEAPIVICGVTGVLPPGCRPRRAGPADLASMRFIKGVPSERFPVGHHYVACAPDSWWWALRDPQGYVQLTHFTSDVTSAGARTRTGGGNEVVFDAPGDPFVHAEVATTLEQRDATPTLPGYGPWPHGLFAVGSALYRVAPISSLGTLQAIRGARAAVAATNSILGSEVRPADAAKWFLDSSTMRAARAHALTAEVCRRPLERFGSPFWRERATDLWALDVPDAIANAARAARRSLALASDGSITGTNLLPATSVSVVDSLGENGPRLVPQRAILAGGGRPVHETLWRQLSEVARAFGVPDPLDGSADAIPRVETLGELLSSEDSRFAANPKRTRRAVGALLEAGILTFPR